MDPKHICLNIMGTHDNILQVNRWGCKANDPGHGWSKWMAKPYKDLTSKTSHFLEFLSPQ
jgi:hypothetical protein